MVKMYETSMTLVLAVSCLVIVTALPANDVKNRASKDVLDSRKYIDILDSRMSYLDTEENSDRAVVFLHGSPTAAYLWRNVIPHVQGLARCLAPDLIGMGHSNKLEGSLYRFVDHYEYLEAWFEAMDLPEKIFLVIHDWGSSLGFHWANLHRDRVAGIVFMEAIVGPLNDFDDFPIGDLFELLRTPLGEVLVLEHNLIIESFPDSVMRNLTEEELNEYRLPYNEPGESRRPTLTWARELPVISEGPDDVVAIITDYQRWLETSSDLPKLFINAEPGMISPGIVNVTANWPNLRTVSEFGGHFIQEESPDEVGQHVAEFIDEIGFP